MRLAAWNLERADLVAGPKYMVSFPLEPAPDTDTVYPWVLRYTWRALTSVPVEPRVRERLKDVETAVVWVLVAETVVAPVVAAALYFDIAERVRGP